MYPITAAAAKTGPQGIPAVPPVNSGFPHQLPALAASAAEP